jgi:hypothetical protein
MCICTGRHMELDDWCFCPVSGMPALYSEYLKYLHAEAPNAVDSVEGAVDTIDPHKHNATFRALASKTIQALDPVKGEMVSSLDLKKSSHEDALAYIRKCNIFVDPTEKMSDATKEEANSMLADL